MSSNRNLTLDIRDCTQYAAVTRGCDFDGRHYGHYWYWFSAGMPAVGS